MQYLKIFTAFFLLIAACLVITEARLANNLNQKQKSRSTTLNPNSQQLKAPLDMHRFKRATNLPKYLKLNLQSFNKKNLFQTSDKK